MLQMQMLDDRFIKAQTTQTDGTGATLTVNRKDGDLSRSGTTFYDHGSTGFANGQSCSDGCCKWLTNQFNASKTRVVGGGKQRTRFRFSGIRRNTDHRLGTPLGFFVENRR